MNPYWYKEIIEWTNEREETNLPQRKFQITYANTTPLEEVELNYLHLQFGLDIVIPPKEEQKEKIENPAML